VADDREQSLRAAIWANPDDLEAHRVHADWLLAHGDATLGEYIQLGLVSDRSSDQERRANMLLKKYRASWLGPARPFVRSWAHDRRGLLATATCEAQVLKDGLAHLLALGPRLRLTVTAMRKRARTTLAELAALPLGHVYGLSLSSGVDDGGISRIAPALAGITHLDLGNNSFGGVGLRAVGRYVAGIRTLSVISDKYTPVWIDAIVETPGFATLECVEVRGHDLRSQVPDDAQLARLWSMPAMKRVNPTRSPGSPTVPMDPSEP
jgi:uncharacterized protein (TIGR02996 family)